eukprot:TRINITY_DN7607_c0_g2_i1.p2 TRINITY_DN7607_c0_g2~~TRINITY_DN7607_c0_g2_i1.p2  ORF type:complete len:195 (-),score=27.78 TRINITY_DN7607_c0_g2_i1:51-635(-)
MLIGMGQLHALAARRFGGSSLELDNWPIGNPNSESPRSTKHRGSHGDRDDDAAERASPLLRLLHEGSEHMLRYVTVFMRADLYGIGQLITCCQQFWGNPDLRALLEEIDRNELPVTCNKCGQKEPVVAFSGAQLRKQSSRCKACVAKRFDLSPEEAKRRQENGRRSLEGVQRQTEQRALDARMRLYPECAGRLS